MVPYLSILIKPTLNVIEQNSNFKEESYYKINLEIMIIFLIIVHLL